MTLAGRIREREADYCRFLDQPGVEPTNNAAERALRPGAAPEADPGHTWRAWKALVGADVERGGNVPAARQFGVRLLRIGARGRGEGARPAKGRHGVKP